MVYVEKVTTNIISSIDKVCDSVSNLNSKLPPLSEPSWQSTDMEENERIACESVSHH